ncbi:Histone-lysine N-methyltransferase SETMAR [Eumeta japonica]|uniref:Histone-lysine N-methyltransferase SETMAR n=1 Tax=Eumeta variegata TaxID=151549 RepID=A0A4C1TGN9_EUMVA|nr:Histone-lysine N-methyltransferase SETMAR [Eumeta japonica]
MRCREKIGDVYGFNAVSVRVEQSWFKRFQARNDVENESGSGRPVTDKIDAIFEKVEKDRHISSYDIAEDLGIDCKRVLTRLNKAGYTKRLDTWIPHKLTKRNFVERVLCNSLLKPNCF